MNYTQFYILNIKISIYVIKLNKKKHIEKVKLVKIKLVKIKLVKIKLVKNFEITT